MSNAFVKLLNSENFTLKEIHDIIKFLESSGGAKFVKEINILKDVAQAEVENAAWTINSTNKDDTTDKILEQRGSFQILKYIQVNFLDVNTMDDHYNKLFKQEQEQVQAEPQ